MKNILYISRISSFFYYSLSSLLSLFLFSLCSRLAYNRCRSVLPSFVGTLKNISAFCHFGPAEERSGQQPTTTKKKKLNFLSSFQFSTSSCCCVEETRFNWNRCAHPIKKGWSGHYITRRGHKLRAVDEPQKEKRTRRMKNTAVIQSKKALPLFFFFVLTGCRYI